MRGQLRARGLAASVVVLSIVGALVPSRRATACSCARGTVEGALAEAALVAELEVVEIGPPRDPESDMTTQRLRARVVRVFATETSVSDGDEIVFVHQTCNSYPHDRTSTGMRFVAFLDRQAGRFTDHYCSFSLGASEPLPYVLLQARRRWLARR